MEKIMNFVIIFSKYIHKLVIISLESKRKKIINANWMIGYSHEGALRRCSLFQHINFFIINQIIGRENIKFTFIFL